MAEPMDHSRNWLIAAWPGMGNVAVIAAGYLIRKLDMRPVVEMPPQAHFDIQGVDVAKGVVATPRMPRSYFFQAPGSNGPGRRLTVFLGEAQPAAGSYEYAMALLERSMEFSPQRVVTFASMATQLHPSQQPRVFGVATREDMLDELRRLEVQPLEEGQIGGMNGLLLGAAAERGMPGMCLMGEIPYFAAGVPNPKAAKAVLDAFALMSGVEVDLEELAHDAEIVDRGLLDMLQRMQGGEEEDEDEGLMAGPGEELAGAVPPAAPEGAAEPPPERKLDVATRERIERLFAEASRDRSKAMGLKQELDRLGVFAQYENRFLDLFRRAE